MSECRLIKHVRLLRHGESTANAGAASADHATIPLTPKGVEQARLAAASFTHAPDLIIASPFARAQTTAKAAVAASPASPFETWLIHEFTYLEPARCANTTLDQRRTWVHAYWSRSDAAYVDGAGAESFRDFIHRAQSFLNRLAEHPAQDIAVFSHGQFINAVAWVIEHKPQIIDGQAMAQWRKYEIENHVPNCGGYILSKHPDGSDWRVVRSSPRERSAGEARRAQDRVGSVIESAQSELSAREIVQVLREVTFEQRTMSRVGTASWAEIHGGHFLVDIDGWQVSLFNDCDTLDYCDECISADGRRWSFHSGDRSGTDPVALLSTWEHQTLERLLKAL
ncbi:broad specificity phosphatase PhoE [Pseudomonas graminis]|nr:broad specificity phosphatase PhoE [Pseudomonas graminis]